MVACNKGFAANDFRILYDYNFILLYFCLDFWTPVICRVDEIVNELDADGPRLCTFGAEDVGYAL